MANTSPSLNIKEVDVVATRAGELVDGLPHPLNTPVIITTPSSVEEEVSRGVVREYPVQVPYLEPLKGKVPEDSGGPGVQAYLSVVAVDVLPSSVANRLHWRPPVEEEQSSEDSPESLDTYLLECLTELNLYPPKDGRRAFLGELRLRPEVVRWDPP